MPRSTSAQRLLFAAVGLALAGCSDNPGAVLIPVPERPVDPAALAAVPATTPDGYPNVVATPVVVAGTPLDAAQQAAAEKSLEATLAAAPRGQPRLSTSAAALQKAGATHVGDARAVIDAPPPQP